MYSDASAIMAGAFAFWGKGGGRPAPVGTGGVRVMGRRMAAAGKVQRGIKAVRG